MLGGRLFLRSPTRPAGLEWGSRIACNSFSGVRGQLYDASYVEDIANMWSRKRKSFTPVAAWHALHLMTKLPVFHIGKNADRSQIEEELLDHMIKDIEGLKPRVLALVAHGLTCARRASVERYISPLHSELKRRGMHVLSARELSQFLNSTSKLPDFARGLSQALAQELAARDLSTFSQRDLGSCLSALSRLGSVATLNTVADYVVDNLADISTEDKFSIMTTCIEGDAPPRVLTALSTAILEDEDLPKRELMRMVFAVRRSPALAQSATIVQTVEEKFIASDLHGFTNTEIISVLSVLVQYRRASPAACAHVLRHHPHPEDDHMLAALTSICGKVMYRSNGAVHILASHMAERKLENWRSDWIAMAVFGLAATDTYNAAVMRRVEEAVLPRITTCTDDTLARVAHAFHQLRHRAPVLTEAIKAEFLKRPHNGASMVPTLTIFRALVLSAAASADVGDKMAQVAARNSALIHGGGRSELACLFARCGRSDAVPPPSIVHTLSPNQRSELYHALLLHRLRLGIVRTDARIAPLRRAWAHAIAPPTFSREVSAALEALGVAHACELRDEFSIDVALVAAGRKIALECNGPRHYYANSGRGGEALVPLPQHVARAEALALLGWTVVDVVYTPWTDFDDEERVAHVRELLEGVGVSVGAHESAEAHAHKDSAAGA